MASLPTIDEFDCTEAYIKYLERKTAYNELGPIPATYDNKYVLGVLVAIDLDASDAQIATLISGIEGLTGVHAANALVGPAAVPLSTDTPVGYDLYASLEAKFRLKLEAV